MTRKIKYLLSVLTLCFCCIILFAQQSKSFGEPGRTIDSLQKLLLTQNEDTNEIKNLNSLAWELKSNNPDTAIRLSTQALALAEKNKWEYGIAKSYNYLGVFNWLKGNYPLALDYYFKALKIRESLNDKKGISEAIGNIGLIYWNQGEYSKALDFFFKALKMAEEIGNKNLIATWLGNLGIVYMEQKDYSKTLDYYFRALKMAEELGDKNAIARHLMNIGNVYKEQKDYSKTFDYYFKALKIAEEVENKNHIAILLENIGDVYMEQKDYSKTLGYYLKALKMTEELGDKNGIASLLGNIGSLYTATKRYGLAENYLQKALTLSAEIKALSLVKDHQRYLSELYTQTDQPSKAMEHYKMFILFRDSLLNQESTKKIVRSEMNFEFDKKQAAEQLAQEKKDALVKEEKQKQKFILWSVAAGLLLSLIFAGLIFSRWRVTQQQKKIIEQKNAHITDSINYAKRIQDALLPSREELSKHIPEHFIFFKPVDIVSGDFYWISSQNGKTILAVADCTGHGVPGACMSMIGNTLLNEIVNEKNVFQPKEILSHLNVGIVHALHQESRLQDDGMDISVCTFDKEKSKITFAGAGHSIYVTQENKEEEIKGDIYSIGSVYGKKNAEFTQREIPYEKNMNIFLYTDGFADQSGGKEGKRFLKKKFTELLQSVAGLNCLEQEKIIKKTFDDWKGKYSQRDDVLVMGIKI